MLTRNDEITVHTLASGSEGNCMVLSAGKVHLLVDAGISVRRVVAGLASIGLKPAELSAIVVSHEHSDHIKGVQPLAEKFDLEVYGIGYAAGHMMMDWKPLFENIRVLPEYGNRYIGDVNVLTFPTSHDASDSTGFRFDWRGSSVGVLTDTGYVTQEAEQVLLGTPLVILESNYDERMLREGPYPVFLKKRIAGEKGHLSNTDAAAFARKLAESGTKQIVIAHVSKENNTEELIMEAMHKALEGFDVEVTIAPRKETSQPFKAGKRRG